MGGAQPLAIDALHSPLVPGLELRGHSGPGTSRLRSPAPAPPADSEGKGEAAAGPRPGRRGQLGEPTALGAQSRMLRRLKSGSSRVGGAPTRGPRSAAGQAAPLQPQPGLADRASATTRAMKMHFCIPVSQQQPDALGGRYTVRLGPGSDWAGRRR